MKKIYTLLVLFFLTLGASAQDMAYQGAIKCTPRVEKAGDQLKIVVDIKLDDIRLRSQQMLVLTPVLESANGVDSYAFAPVVVTGRARHRALTRAMEYGTVRFDNKPYAIVVRKNNTYQAVTVPMTVPYKEWMQTASLILLEDASGCVGCGHIGNQYALLTPLFPAVEQPKPVVASPTLYQPTYRLSYITPPVEPVKERSEAYVCRLNYVVARYELLRDYKDNARILNEVDGIITELQRNPDLTITSASVIGYASPEGNYNSNITLSENRARAFLNYLRDRYNWNTYSIHSEGRGEDWPGLREAVMRASYVPDRDQVLSIIDNTIDVAARKQRLQALSGGRTYRWLLDELYPPLRRNEYRVAYVARAFNIEEAKALIRTKPHLLSLNEMFLVANTYPKESENYRYIFDVAARLFPQDPVANLNAGAVEIEAGLYDAAIQRLSRLSTAEAWNNLGVAYVHKGDLVNAEANFRRGVAAGSIDAAQNLTELERVKASR